MSIQIECFEQNYDNDQFKEITFEHFTQLLSTFNREQTVVSARTRKTYGDLNNLIT